MRALDLGVALCGARDLPAFRVGTIHVGTGACARLAAKLYPAARFLTSLLMSLKSKLGFDGPNSEVRRTEY